MEAGAVSYASKNFILNSLDESVYREIRERAEETEMPLGRVLYHSYEKPDFVYFPLTSVISVVTLLENGSGVESGIIGREGVLGTSTVLTDEPVFSEVTVQLSGRGLQMRVEDFQGFFEESAEFRKLVLKYIHAFISQISQNAACLCYHSIEKRLARWLLMFNDRSMTETLEMTQEFIAQMLGCHRPSVSISANKLQKLDLITYNRGTIRILDRASLENFSCECYTVINRALSSYQNFSKAGNHM